MMKTLVYVCEEWHQYNQTWADVGYSLSEAVARKWYKEKPQDRGFRAETLMEFMDGSPIFEAIEKTTVK